MNTILLQSTVMPASLWAVGTAIVASLLSVVTILWKLYQVEKKEKETALTDKLELVVKYTDKREDDNRKNVEMLLRVQDGFESLVKHSDKFTGMITKTEKEDIMRTFHEIRRDVKEVHDRILDQK